MVIYVGQKTFNKKILSYLFNILYEFEKDKLETLNKLLDIKQIEIYDEKQKYNYLENIQNKDYKLKINGDELTINFFDYILSNLQIVDYISLDIFIKNINNKDNWTIQRFYKNNYLFFNEDISKTVEENIFDFIKNNRVLKRAINAVEKFKLYNYPFDDKKMIQQVKNSLFVFPFSCSSIGGLTLKKFGLILINNRISPIEELLSLEEYFFVFLLKGMNYKTIYIHEINFHYLLYLIYANNYSKTFMTPKKLFTYYKVNEGDAGEKGECLLFGKKINLIFIRAALLLSDNKEYNLKENEDFNVISEKFLKFNMPNKLGDLNDFNKIVNKNSFTKKLYNIITNKIKYNKKSKKKKNDLGQHTFVASKIDNIFEKEMQEFILYDQRFIIFNQSMNVKSFDIEFSDSD